MHLRMYRPYNVLIYFFSQVKKDVGDVDILVNNAGIVTGMKFLECSDELIEKTMDVNVNAHFWVIHISSFSHRFSKKKLVITISGYNNCLKLLCFNYFYKALFVSLQTKLSFMLVLWNLLRCK